MKLSNSLITWIFLQALEGMCNEPEYLCGDCTRFQHFRALSNEHEGTARDTEGVGCNVIVTEVIFSFRKSVFRDVRTDYNLYLENTLPFVSQFINDFSDYDISQSHDWECPSLSPHVLLGIAYRGYRILPIKLQYFFLSSEQYNGIYTSRKIRLIQCRKLCYRREKVLHWKKLEIYRI